MADPNALLHGPRGRNLIILAAIAAVSIVLAALALSHEASLVAPRYTPRTFFPGLSEQVRNHVARIHIVSGKYGAFDIVFKPSKGYVLPQEHDYPADFTQVSRLLNGMAGLETIAPKTNRADWLHYLDLGAPEKGGKGTEISLLGEHGKVIASLIAGKTEDIGETSGYIGLFVRKPASTQSWLTRSVFEAKPDPKDWLNKDVIGLVRARIQEVDVTPPDGAAYTVRREKTSDPDFTLTKLPKGRTLAYTTAPDGVASSLVGFTFDKVAPASDFDFSKAARLVTKTFDGLTVTAQIIKRGAEYWVTLSAEAADGKTDAEAEARTINGHASDWAYQIPAYKGAQFTTTLESMLKPLKKKD